MKVGLQMPTEHPIGLPYRPRFEGVLKQVAIARDYGFDCILKGHGYVWPLQTMQPIPFLSRLAAEVGDMYLGTGILLLPMLHPVDVAEQIAALDTICNGRFFFGVGLGYADAGFQAFGIDKKDRVGRFEESLEIIKQMWTQDTVTFKGDHFSLSGVVPSARPVQKPYPPIWIAANNHPAVRRAARMGNAWYANPHAEFATLEEQVRIYKEALAEAQAPAPEYMPLCKEIYVAETTEAAFRECGPYLENRYQVYEKEGQDQALPTGDRFDKPFQELAQDRFVIGDPDECVRGIKRYEALGFNYMIFNFQWAGMSSEMSTKCLHLLGREVLPRLR